MKQRVDRFWLYVMMMLATAFVGNIIVSLSLGLGYLKPKIDQYVEANCTLTHIIPKDGTCICPQCYYYTTKCDIKVCPCRSYYTVYNITSNHFNQTIAYAVGYIVYPIQERYRCYVILGDASNSITSLIFRMPVEEEALGWILLFSLMDGIITSLFIIVSCMAFKYSKH